LEELLMVLEKAATEIALEMWLSAWARHHVAVVAVSRGLEVKLLAERWRPW
jgi:hypothetical protein